MSDDRSPETWHDPIVAEVRQAGETGVPLKPVGA
jgi:hypothetical protein